MYPREEHKGIVLTGNGLEQANSLHMILIWFFFERSRQKARWDRGQVEQHKLYTSL